MRLWTFYREAAHEEVTGGVPGVPVQDDEQQGVDKGVNKSDMESHLTLENMTDLEIFKFFFQQIKNKILFTRGIFLTDQSFFNIGSVSQPVTSGLCLTIMCFFNTPCENFFSCKQIIVVTSDTVLCIMS